MTCSPGARRSQLRRCAALLLLPAAIVVVGCSGPPVATGTEACSARSQIHTAAQALDSVDFGHPDAGELQSSLALLRSGLTRAEAAVPLSQNVELRQLGGVPHLQLLRDHVIALMAEVSKAESSHDAVDWARVEADVAVQSREAQRIVGAIHGCGSK